MSNEAVVHAHGAVTTHEGHGDHHHEHHHHETFITKYVFSQDHKMIAKQFLITGMVWAVLGGLMSVLFRLQLGYPDATFPWLEDILGKWAKGGRITPEAYYALVTTHGTVLVFFVLTAGLSGTFANFLIPLQVGARDMASPFMNMLSYWFFFAASIVMLSSMFVETGPFSGGWTAYPPLSALGDASPGSKIGMDMWLISMALFVVSSLLGGLNYIATVLNMRTKGMSMTRMPLTIWALFFTAVLGVLSFPVLFSGFILLIFDRNFGTSFYLSDIFINGVGALPNEGGSAILYQHLFWFLGHPEVYIILLPAMGMVSEILSVNSRKPIFGYMAMIGSLFAIAILAFLVWAHHMFVTGLNPFLGSIFVLLTLLIAVPSAIKVFNWLTTLWRGNIRFTPGMMFAIGFVSLFISGGLTGIWLGNSALDIHLHDTYFVIAHFHIVMGVASMFGMFAGIYHWFPKMYGRYLNNTMGYIHFWVTIAGAYLIFWPMHYEGLAGMPRRYYDYSIWESFKQFAELNRFISTVAMIVFAVQLLFLFNFFYSIFKGRKVTTLNPWGATTLEWTTPIKPGHGNWVGEIPEVHRWAYDYGKDGKEFIAQTTPVGADESHH
ncbi:MAG: cbb3-type cytochrome c oxidase subunit I [Sediminibacterium sp. Gen4]|jgi:cytochrome c oxidase subunit I|uniref:cytochrome c oxidase subunit I n=1 Tax=unclassified Sediminibacterium TaxID=2635961 RepID=UPI0015B7AA96|nr:MULTISPECIES: cbb3-type cytochrome c oxidase subunit I [unclassified Sediminibacterium]MBW0163061.1 cbb3-type cytochrome c oxidase subunit I [Sediminibacterium sp.]MDZ4070674.1 cbb3-type cytochrome c oxidase subunit I [Sediminibacterium sp.]NWK66379.1 cbb3-type cytochrome c oxidase subunit I [Sediminibacterium sp. Gen4]